MVAVYYCDVGSPWHHEKCKSESLLSPCHSSFSKGIHVTIWYVSLQTFHVHLHVCTHTHTQTCAHTQRCATYMHLQLATMTQDHLYMLTDTDLSFF